jgi:hypothetical protein
VLGAGRATFAFRGSHRRDCGVAESQARQQFELLSGFERVGLRAQERVDGVQVLRLQFRVGRDGESPEAIVLVAHASGVAKLLHGIRGPSRHFGEEGVVGGERTGDFALDVAQRDVQRYLGLPLSRFRRLDVSRVPVQQREWNSHAEPKPTLLVVRTLAREVGRDPY